MNDEHNPASTGEAVSDIERAPQRRQRPARRPRFNGTREHDQRYAALLLALVSALTFIRQPEVQTALTRVTVRWLDSLASTGNAAKSETKGGE